MQMRSPENLLAQEMMAIHSAEQQVSQVLPKMCEMVSNRRLRQMLETRMKQGERLIQEIESEMAEMDGAASGKRERNEAAAGLIALAERMIGDTKDPNMRDAAVIGNVQKVEHYCIAAWGTAKAFGEAMGWDDVARTMDHALKEGRQLDEQLTQLAEKEVNPAMLRDGGARQQNPSSAKSGRGRGEETSRDGDRREARGDSRGDEQSGRQTEQSRSAENRGGDDSRRAKGSEEESRSRKGGQSARGGDQGEDAADLKAREYRDEQGNIHHHTHEYMSRHGKDGR